MKFEINEGVKRDCLSSTLFYTTSYAFTKFAECTGTECKQNGIIKKGVLFSTRSECGDTQ
jgi:hypothetical protein